ncbi:MAG: hypothetical protein K2O36_00185 [Ruminococcus sp.]|nr:hypothetical protein [Ruminococcus sp.]
MNEKILKIMALALEISPHNEYRAYVDKPRVKVEYSSEFAPFLKVTVIRSFKGRNIVVSEMFCFNHEKETKLDEIIEWLETIKAEG